MLTNARFRSRCILSGFTLISGKIFWRFNFISNEFWNMLSNLLFQILVCSAYVHNITVTRVFVYNITLLIFCLLISEVILFCLLISEVMLYTNTNVVPNNWKNEFDNIFQNLLEIKLNLKKISLDVNVNPLKMHLFRIR